MTTKRENSSRLAPDAAARDAARREQTTVADGVVRGEGIEFVTQKVSVWERAAVLAAIAEAREEETNRVRRVKRRDREPWARSQRTPEGFG